MLDLVVWVPWSTFTSLEDRLDELVSSTGFIEFHVDDAEEYEFRELT